MRSAFAALCVCCAHSRLVAFHVDDESCSGLLNYGHNRSEQTIKCARFFASLANLSATLAAESSMLEKRGAGSWAKLQLAVDSGTAWTCPTGTNGCFNLTFGGKTVSVAEHVIDLADEAVIMDYDRSPSTLYARAKPYLDYRLFGSQAWQESVRGRGYFAVERHQGPIVANNKRSGNGKANERQYRADAEASIVQRPCCLHRRQLEGPIRTRA